MMEDEQLMDELDMKCFDCNIDHEVSLNRFNFFLTEKAAKEYIEKDRHNLRKVKTYGVYLYKNDEMLNVINILKKIGKELKKENK